MGYDDVSGGCSFKLLLMDIEQTPRVAARPALPLDPKAHALGGVCVRMCEILILDVTNVRAWL